MFEDYTIPQALPTLPISIVKLFIEVRAIAHGAMRLGLECEAALHFAERAREVKARITR